MASAPAQLPAKNIEAERQIFCAAPYIQTKRSHQRNFEAKYLRLALGFLELHGAARFAAGAAHIM